MSIGNVQAARLFRSARKHARARHYIAALADLDRAIRLTPTGVLYDYRGVLLALMERTPEALASFASALSLTAFPEKQAEIHFHRGLLHGRERSYDLALMDVSQALQLNPCNLTYREAREKMEQERACNTSPDVCLSS